MLTKDPASSSEEPGLSFLTVRLLFFALYGTVLFVNKENQKNFRRMLTHPPAAGGPNLGLFVGLWFSGAGALG
ncbi:hypothetical protein [uncultured Rikenella sp.]|uniref:hypothetical protein n=1 Tax=uncultured Rikenella sp. TaxID=368003 RepID=UPI0026245C04|nr:hypothetical protein [uncultured Rikenella sp.]